MPPSFAAGAAAASASAAFSAAAVSSAKLTSGASSRAWVSVMTASSIEVGSMVRGLYERRARPVGFRRPSATEESGRQPGCLAAELLEGHADRSNLCPCLPAMIELWSTPRPRRPSDPDQRLARRLAAATRARSRRSTGAAAGLLRVRSARCATVRRRGCPAAGLPRGLASDADYDPRRAAADLGMTIARGRAIDQLRRRVPEPAGNLAGAEQARSAVDEMRNWSSSGASPACSSGFIPTSRSVLRMRFYDELTQSDRRAHRSRSGQ